MPCATHLSLCMFLSQQGWAGSWGSSPALAAAANTHGVLSRVVKRKTHHTPSDRYFVCTNSVQNLYFCPQSSNWSSLKCWSWASGCLQEALVIKEKQDQSSRTGNGRWQKIQAANRKSECVGKIRNLQPCVGKAAGGERAVQHDVFILSCEVATKCT